MKRMKVGCLWLPFAKRVRKRRSWSVILLPKLGRLAASGAELVRKIMALVGPLLAEKARSENQRRRHRHHRSSHVVAHRARAERVEGAQRPSTSLPRAREAARERTSPGMSMETGGVDSAT